MSTFDDDDVPQGMPPGTKMGVIALATLAPAVILVGILLSAKMNARSEPVETRMPAKSAVPVSRAPRKAEPREVPFDYAKKRDEIESEISSFLVKMVTAAIVYLVFWILVMVWVARDAKSRCIDGGAVWIIVIFFTSFIGLLIYLASRPHGILTTCARCQNRKLNYALICPHCGQREPDATASPD